MAERNTLARPYAEAVFALARQRGVLPEWSERLRFLAAVAADDEVAGLIHDPQVTRERLTGLLLEIGRERLGREGANFVRLLVQNRRLDLLPEIVSQFMHLKAHAEGTVEAEVVSAVELDSGQLQRVAAAMKKRLGREVHLSTRLDASLLGGMIIRAGDLVIDGSLRGRLRGLSSKLSR